MPLELLNEKVLNTGLVLLLPATFFAIYLYGRNKKLNSNKEWREKYFNKFNFKQQSKEIDPIEHIRVNSTSAEAAYKIYEECNTPYKALILGMQRSNDGKCFGWREGSSYKWMSYSKAIENVKYFGSALLKKFPLNKYKVDNIAPIGFYMGNRPQCTIAQFGCVCYGYTIVPFYDAYGIENMKGLIELTQTSAIITDTEKRVGNFLNGYDKEKLKSLKTIIYICDEINDNLKKLAENYEIELINYNDFIKLGEKNLVQPNLNCNDEDVYAIVPTSGTTGEPKAAILTQKGIMFFAASYYATTATSGAVFNENDIFFSYLPNAHVFDLSSMVSIMSRGVAIGYSRGDPKLLVEDMQTLRPTMVPMVARMMQKIHDKVMNGIKEKGKLFEVLFNMAVDAKIKEREQGIIRQNSLWDRLMFNKIRALVGGRIRLICCGAAPFPKYALNVMRFSRAVFSCYIFEGYGQTESTSATSVSHPVDPNFEHVGPPVLCLEVKLIDVPEMGYYSKNNCGEICIRGPTIFSGYYKNVEKTRETIDENGWLHTGDIGMWLENGCLKVVDRRKQIFKLSQGEYVAPEKVENVIRRSQLVDQCYVDGDSLEHFIVAIIVPEPEASKKWALDNNLKFDLSELCNNKQFKKAIMSDIEKISRDNKLNGFEIPRNVYLFSELFSVENGLITPTQKNKRIALRKHFDSIIKQLYKDGEFAF